MIYPDDFYYTEEQSSFVFSENPPGDLVVEKLLQAKPYWRQPNEQPIRKQKTLIIADWTASTWTYERITSINALINQLIHDKFPVYAWSNYKFTELSLNGLDSIYLRSNMTPAPHQDIISFAESQHQWRNDELCVLDDYALQGLITPESQLEIRSIKTTDILRSIHDKNSIIACILQAIPKIEIVDVDGSVHSEFGEEKAKQLNATITQTSIAEIGSFTTINDLESIRQDTNILSHFLAFYNEVPKVKTLWMKDHDPEEFHSKYQLFLTPLHARIRSLQLDSSLLNRLNLHQAYLENLESLSLTNHEKEQYDDDFLSILLTNAPKLRKIEIRDLDCGSFKLTIACHQLESLLLTRCQIDQDTLLMLLRQSTHIRQLALTDVVFKGASEANWDGLSFDCLELLSLKSTHLNEEKILRILKQSPNIKDLSFTNILNIPSIDGNEITFNQLERLSITIDQSPESIQQLSIIIKKAPHLRALEINFREIPSDLQSLSNLDLAKIESFSVSSSLPDLLPIFTLLFNKCHHLIEINVTHKNHRKILDVTSMLTDLETPKLKRLGLYFCTMTLESLSNIVNKSLHLREINYTPIISNKFKPEQLEAMLAASDNLSLHEPYLSKYKKILLSKLNNVTDNIDRPHDSSAHKNFRPKPPFKFKGIHNTKNQTMIIDRVSQYMSLMRIHTSLINPIQKGICNALSHWYLNEEPAVFTRKVNMIREWDGHTTPDEQLRLIFKHLISLIKRYQLPSSNNALSYYLGDSLEIFLNDLHEPCVLENPWHAICIKPHEQSSYWWVYDPNYGDGAKKVPQTALKDTINHTIGLLVSCKKYTSLEPNIGKIGLFIQNGGLLRLSYYYNLPMKYIPEKFTYTLENLDGLLLKDNHGIPAWVIGIQNGKTAGYTADLLKQFTALGQQTSLKQLKDSILELKGFQQHVLMSALLQYTDQHDHAGLTLAITHLYAQLVINGNLVKNGIMDASYQLLDSCLITPLAQALSYAQSLIPWRKIVYYPSLPNPHGNTLTIRHDYEVFAESPEAYCQHTIQSPVLKKLIELSSMEAIQTLSLLLLKTCLSTSRPVFYVHSADDLRCQSPFIKYQTHDVGFVSAGPGGRLFDFIQSASNNPASSPVLIVNYANFKPSEMARFNALLDDVRYADDIPLPEKTQIIGLINISDPNCYKGADCYSRMDRRERCPFDNKSLSFALKPLPFIADHDDIPAHTINLFRSDDWRERLLGRWVIQGDQLFFKQGELKAAIESNQPLIIENGKWTDLDFQQFWHEAFLRKEIAYSGGILKLPNASLQLIKREGYDWPKLRRQSTCSYGFSMPLISTPILNPSRFGCFFNTYQCDNETKKLRTLPGLLEQNQGKTLDVNMTRVLSEDNWAALLVECQKYNITLSCHLGLNLQMPEKWAIHPHEEHKDTPFSRMPKHTQLIESTDPDTTIAQLLIDNKDDWNVIDITECDASDLLIKIRAKLNIPEHAFEFTQTTGLLATSGLHQNIILTGDFSNELSDQLAGLLLQRFESVPADKLILVSKNMDNFQYLRIKTHIVSPKEKRLLIEPKYNAIDILTSQQLSEESLAQLEARLIYHRLNPTDQTDNAWQGILDTPAENDQAHGLFDLNTSESVSTAFNQHRLDAMNARLAASPYVLITGLTGVGKSTFVEQYLSSGTHMFHGANQIQDWALAKAKNEDYQILFLDEANISSRQWSEFEGLFNNPPSIFINSVYYSLSPQHKVIFAGNPINYGDRYLAPFFMRHGNALLFQPMPFAYIYEEILKPILMAPILQNHCTQIASDLLEVYEFLCRISQKDVLISPREIQMMALMIWSYTQAIPDIDARQVQNATHYYRYHLAKELVPKMYQIEFDERFTPTSALPRLINQRPASDPHYVLTPSRNEVVYQLHDLLQLNQTRRELTVTAPDALLYGGLGGLVIQGSSGIGKSQLVMQTLVAAGYHKRTYRAVNDPVTSTSRIFYHMPASMQYDVKAQLLNQAFHEGAIVLIDEINASPMMENLLNDLLMGKTLDKNRPQQPGFFIIGTQNPPTMQGRHRPSPALARRLLTINLPDYTQDEMKMILINQGLPEDKSEPWLCAYDAAYETAIRRNSSFIPTFRDLLKSVAAAQETMSSPILDISPISDLLSKFELKVIALESERLNKPNYENIAKQARILHKRLFNANEVFLASCHLDPLASQTLKQTCKSAIKAAEDTCEFEKHRGFIQTTPVLREIALCIRAIGNVLALIALPVVKCVKHYVFRDDTPVFKYGITETFFCPPKTDSYEKLQELKKGYDACLFASKIGYELT